jgi:hypothetical protein
MPMIETNVCMTLTKVFGDTETGVWSNMSSKKSHHRLVSANRNLPARRNTTDAPESGILVRNAG